MRTRGIAVEGGLYPVPVMGVEIDIRDPVAGRHRRRDGDRTIVVDAEPRRSSPHGVVLAAGGSISMDRSPLHEGVHGLYRRACVQGRSIMNGGEKRVVRCPQPVEAQIDGLGHPLGYRLRVSDRLHVGVRVHGEQLLREGGPRSFDVEIASVKPSQTGEQGHRELIPGRLQRVFIAEVVRGQLVSVDDQKPSVRTRYANRVGQSPSPAPLVLRSALRVVVQYQPQLTKPGRVRTRDEGGGAG